MCFNQSWRQLHLSPSWKTPPGPQWGFPPWSQWRAACWGWGKRQHLVLFFPPLLNSLSWQFLKSLELLKSALVKKRYRHDSEVVIFRNKLMFKRIHFTECTDSESASRQNSAVEAQLADTACFSQSTYSHTYRRRSSAVEYSRCLVKCYWIGQKQQRHSWFCALNQVQGAVCSWYWKQLQFRVLCTTELGWVNAAGWADVTVTVTPGPTGGADFCNSWLLACYLKRTAANVATW